MIRKIIQLLTVLSVFALIISPIRVHATPGQWSANSSYIYYNDGNVGLGTSSPSHKLSIVGSTTTQNTDLIKIGTVDSRYWQFTAGKYAHSLYGDYALIISQPVSLWPGDCGNCPGDLVLQPGRNTIIDVGNVGIGTSNPGSYKLAVNGAIRAKSIYVDNSAWADYVFEEDYKLMPLSELESFIEEHKHLPGISSADDVSNNGQNLGELQTKQMEKIEELTLYTLQQEKKITQLEKQNNDLQERLKRLEDLLK